MQQKTPIDKLESFLQVRFAYMRGFALNKTTLGQALRLVPNEKVALLCDMIKYIEKKSISNQGKNEKRLKK